MNDKYKKKENTYYNIFKVHGNVFGTDQFIFAPKRYDDIYNDPVFIRKKELKEFLDVFNKNPNGKYIIYGATGMGKTTFLSYGWQ